MAGMQTPKFYSMGIMFFGTIDQRGGTCMSYTGGLNQMVRACCCMKQGLHPFRHLKEGFQISHGDKISLLYTAASPLMKNL